MKFFPAGLFLVLAWLAITGSASPHNLALGFLVAALSLWITRGQRPAGVGRVRPLAILVLLLVFLRELALSAWTVAVLVLRPRLEVRPGILAFPLTVTGDIEITLLAQLITLTPGTLSVDVSDDRSTLYVHALDCSDPEAVKRDIAGGFERRILEAFR